MAGNDAGRRNQHNFGALPTKRRFLTIEYPHNGKEDEVFVFSAVTRDFCDLFVLAHRTLGGKTNNSSNKSCNGRGECFSPTSQVLVCLDKPPLLPLLTLLVNLRFVGGTPQ